MLLNQELLSTLTAQAKANPRLRQNYDIRQCAAWFYSKVLIIYYQSYDDNY